MRAHLDRVNEQRERLAARGEVQHTNMKVDALLLFLPGDCCCGCCSSERIGYIGVGSGPAPAQALLLQGSVKKDDNVASQNRTAWE